MKISIKGEQARQEEKRKKALCEFVKCQLEKRSRERISFELQWQMNINFLLGNQYCDILPEAGKLYDQEKAYAWQEREVYNHIAPIAESRLAKLSKISPQMSVRPATGDEEDIQCAKVSSAVLASAFNRLNMGEVIGEATMWSELCGTAFYKQVWVSSAGKVLGKTKDGKLVREGDVASVVCPPHEIYPDTPYVQSIERCKSVIHAHIHSCAEVRETWHIEVEPQAVKSFSFGETAAIGGMGYSACVSKLGEQMQEDSVMVTEYFEVPSVEYPDGRYIVCSGETLLHEGILPYINGEGGERKLPFVQQDSISRPGCIWGISIIERCIPIQRAYNAVRNRKHEFLNRAATGVLTVEEGAMDTEELEDEGLIPGKVLVYRQGANPPGLLPSGSLPNEFMQEENALLEEFTLISGTSDLMRQSVAPSSLSSGTALSIIAEQDDTRLAITAEKMRNAVLEISRQWLRLFRQFAGKMRIERVIGQNGEISKMYWNASELTSDDVVHQTENELSNSLSNRKQLIYELLAKGLFSGADGSIDERTKARVLQALGMGDWENISDITEVHVQRADRENLALEKNEPAKVLESDDHGVHIAQHAKHILSEKFEAQFGLDSREYIRFEEHINQHKIFMEAETDERNDGTT